MPISLAREKLISKIATAIAAAALLCTPLFSRADNVNPDQLNEYSNAAGHEPAPRVESLLLKLGREHVDDIPKGSSATALGWAVNNNKDPAVALMLLRYGASPTKRIDDYFMPLGLAVEKDRGDLVRAFAQREAIGMMPDHGAALFERAPNDGMRKLLVSLGAVPGKLSTDVLRRWYYEAASHGTPAQVESLLLEIGRKHVDDKDNNGSNALFKALGNNPDPAVALLLLKYGASATTTIGNDHTYTLLARAAEKGYTDVVRELARRGALEASADHGALALAYAGNDATKQLLLQLGVAPPKPDPVQLLRAFHTAAAHGSPAEVEKWLKQIGRENIDARDADGRTALLIALQSNPDPSVALLLLREGANAITTDAYHTLLVQAVDKGNLELVRDLIRHDAISSSKDHGGDALNHATTIEMAKLLLESGADPNQGSANGDTALLAHFTPRWAAATDSTPVLLAMIEMGTDVRAPNALTGETVLHKAAEWNNVIIATALLDHGADVNARDHNGTTPLMQAAMSGLYSDLYRPKDQVVALLLKHGANPNLGMKYEGYGPEGMWTPLTAAHKQPELTRLLLQAGADPRLPNGAGKTALDLTESPEVATLLLKAGAGTRAQTLLNHVGLSPALFTKLNRIGRTLLPFAPVLILYLPPLLYLPVFAVVPRLRNNDQCRGIAVGAAITLPVLVIYSFTVLFLTVRTFDWVAGKVLEFAMPGIALGAWIVAFVAFSKGRAWYAKRQEQGMA